MAKDGEIYKSEAMASVHEMTEGAHEIGVIDEKTMRSFDEACLISRTPVEIEETVLQA